MHYCFRDWEIRYINLETQIFLANSYRDSKIFALLI